MATGDTISVSLATEEVLFLLRLLGLKTIPGLGEDPAASLGEEQVAAARVAGLNALRARGWVQVHQTEEGAKYTLESALAALLIASATAPRMMHVRRQRVDGAVEGTYVHFAPDLTVLHTMTEPGLHGFTGTVQLTDAIGRLSARLGLNSQAAPAGNALRCPSTAFDQLLDSVRQGDEARALQVLTDSQLSVTAARHLLKSLQGLRANSLIALFDIGSEVTPASVQGFTLLDTPVGFWLAEICQHPTESVDIALEPVSASEVLHRLERLVRGEDNLPNP